ncbi:hypothetical protein [Beutenbergia cavernae]|uniref:hypothetical protein n=1 Tax=Beutenbergia cavernae TaxID=84757 RepID=UPI0011813A86|nr:hypothetical protein [Beutenbergia cavernae]
MTGPNEYAALRARIEDQLAEAVRASDDLTVPASAQGVGRSDDGVARVAVDHQGFLADVQFSAGIADLDAAELRTVFLAALQAARDDLRGESPPVARPVDLTDTSIIDALDAILRGERPAHGTGED